MCIICTGEYHGRTEINCRCPLITEIPVIPGLQRLDCWECPLLTKIPVIPGLQTLVLGWCPNIREIPLIPGLQELNCWHCPLLTKIPVIPGLQFLDYYNCPWVKPSPEKLDLLVFLQRKIRKILAKKKRIIGFPCYLLSILEKY